MFNFRGGQVGDTTPGAPTPSTLQKGSPGVSASGKSSIGFSPRVSGMEFAPKDRRQEDGSFTQINKQVAEWDSQMDSLDRKQEQLLNDQWTLLRTQIGSLMSALAEVKSELSELSENVVPKEVEQIVNNLLGSHEDHGVAHAGLMERVTYLENFVGESADRHAQEIQGVNGNHEEHKASMEIRLEDLENKHSKELEEAFAKCAQLSSHTTVEERVDFLEKYIGETADKHDNHKCNMETRLEYIETLIGDNADKHSSDITAAQGQLGSLEAAVALCAKHDHASGLEARLEYLEKLLGESSDMHATHQAHRTTMETRLEYLEGLLGDNADKHSKEIEDAKGRVGSLEEAVIQCAQKEHHSTLETRMGFLEKCLGESADKHDSHKVNMEGRLEYIEASIGDNADKHWKEIESAKGKMKDLDTAISSCARTEHHNTLETRMEYLEALLGDSADKHEKHVKDLEVAHTKLKDLSSKVNGDGTLREQKHSTLEDRLDTIMSKFEETTENHSKRVSSLEAGHVKLKNTHDELSTNMRGETSARHEKHGLVDERLSSMENFLQQNFDRTVKELEDSKQKLREAQAKMDQTRTSIDSHRNTTDQRLEYIETSMADNSGAKFVDLTKDIEKRLHYMQEDQKRARDVLESSLMEQIKLEHSLFDDQARQSKEQWERELKARMAYQDQYKDLISQERDGRDSLEHHVDQRLVELERGMSMETKRLWVALDKHSHDGLQETVVAPPRVETVVAPPVVEILPPVTQIVEMLHSPRVPMYNVVQGPQMVGGPFSPTSNGMRTLAGGQRITASATSIGMKSPRGLADAYRETRTSSRVTIGSNRPTERAVNVALS